MKYRFLIADDHSAIRKGLKNILTTAFSEVEFDEAVNGRDAWKKIKEEKWDLIILDLELPFKDGFEILSNMKRENIRFPVLVFSFHKEELIALRAIKAGAFGCLTKGVSDTELIGAISQILSGKKYISPVVAEILANQLENPLVNLPHELLSDREYQILLLITSGKTITEISRDRSLSISSVNTYRSRILQKLQLKNNAELISYAIRNSLA